MASMAIANCRETPTSDVRCMWPSLGIIRQARLEARGVDTHMISREARLEARKLEKSSMRSSFIFWICGPRLLDVATGRVWDSFVLLPRILGCRGSFTRAFLPGRLVFLQMRNLRCTCTQDLRILILSPNEPPKSANFALSIRAPRGRNQAGPLFFPIRKFSSSFSSEPCSSPWNFIGTF